MDVTELKISPKIHDAWALFNSNVENRGHVNRNSLGKTTEQEIKESWMSSIKAVQKIAEDTKKYPAATILEIGCSTGINCFALSHLYKNSQVYGIEPEQEALQVANAILEENPTYKIKFINGVGEKLPFPENGFDLIVCNTVIEHVMNVEQVIQEMARVLKPSGYIHLGCPNYNWPYEPHLSIWCIPRLGKSFVSMCAKLQSKGDETPFLKHLQFVHPTMLENFFKTADLSSENLFSKKIDQIGTGNTENLYKYKSLGKLLTYAHKYKLLFLIKYLILKFKIYPSLLYLLRKNDHAHPSYC